MIFIYSSFSKDKILNSEGSVLSNIKGGPAFYIEKVFKDNKFPYTLKTRKVINVEIKLEKNKEIGRVKEKIKSHKVSLANCVEPILISTIGKEWIFNNQPKKQAEIFLDIQGYVRNLNFLGGKAFFNAPFLKNIFCLKGTEEELKFLPKKIIKDQKNKCLIVTRGNDGSVIYYKNKKFVFKPLKKIRTASTIGVGDTFFASFVLNFIESNGNIIKSGQTATNDAANFLSKTSYAEQVL